MDEPDLFGKLVALTQALEEAGIPHAFGGAIALAAYAEPRGTDDLDVGIFLGSDHLERVVAVLARLGADVEVDLDQVRRGDWGRFYWGDTAIDVFFSFSDLHLESAARIRHLDASGVLVPVLAPEDLVAHKIIFNRPSDWVDIDRVLDSVPDFDSAIVRRWVIELYATPEARRRLVRLNAIAELHRIPAAKLPSAPSLRERLRDRGHRHQDDLGFGR